MRIATALSLLMAPLCAVAQVPDPLFWETEADFHRQVDEGQFNDRLELHLLQYASDPDWRLDWAAARFARNGLFGEYGSTTTKELYVDSQIAVNLFPAGWLQIRYDRRDREDGRFELADQRIEAVFHVGPAWGLVLTGWPAFDKENSSLGGGVHLGELRGPSRLELRVVDERWIWNDKADGEVRFTKDPLRILVDGSGTAGPWRVRGSVDWGLPYRAVEQAAVGEGGERSTGGFQRFLDLEAEYAAAPWTAALRLTGARLERTQSGWTGTPLSLDRAWGRAVLSFRRSLGRWSISALAGWASQRDRFTSPEDPTGTYASDALLGGIDGGWHATDAFQLRLGYLASAQRLEREVTGAGPLSPRSERQYLDKAHVRALYAFGPQMAVEFLLSQALRGGSFGGGSVKALFVF